MHGAPVALDYIHRAMSEFSQDCRFLVFSDTSQDVSWCRANIHGEQISFARGDSDLEDFATMSACDHHIISNSTFSWWAAWLNPAVNKRVIAPSIWSAPQSKVEMLTDDLLPTDWIKL